MKKSYETFTTAQVAVTTAATKIKASADGGDAVTIQNLGATAVYIGPNSSVTVANGFPIPGVAGSSLTLEVTDEVWAIVASGSQAVAVLSTF